MNLIRKISMNTTTSTYEVEKNGVVYLKYKRLDEIPYIRHGFSTRLGGVSTGDLSSMNLSFTRGDATEHVLENYERISKAMGIKVDNMVASDQTHTNHVRRMTKTDCKKGIQLPRDYSDVDGMVTDEPGVALVTYYADCVPLYFADTKRKAIGLSHAGWKGTLHRIGEKTIEAMIEYYHSKPEDIVVCIGPSICQDCYEVSEDVAVSFYDAFDCAYHNNILYDKGNGKYQLNLWEANRIVLKQAGILEENIVMPDLCTCCNPSMLFSHRATGGRRGNLAAFLQISDI